jgi:hypothetical protein
MRECESPHSNTNEMSRGAVRCRDVQRWTTRGRYHVEFRNGSVHQCHFAHTFKKGEGACDYMLKCSDGGDGNTKIIIVKTNKVERSKRQWLSSLPLSDVIYFEVLARDVIEVSRDVVEGLMAAV